MFDYHRVICHIWNQIFYVVVALTVWWFISYLPTGEYTSAELIQQMEDDTMSNSTSSALVISYVIVFYIIMLMIIVTGYYITYLIIDCIRGTRKMPYILILPVIVSYMVFNRDVLWLIACMVYHTIWYVTVSVVIGALFHGITSTISIYRECESNCDSHRS